MAEWTNCPKCNDLVPLRSEPTTCYKCGVAVPTIQKPKRPFYSHVEVAFLIVVGAGLALLVLVGVVLSYLPKSAESVVGVLATVVLGVLVVGGWTMYQFLVSKGDE